MPARKTLYELLGVSRDASSNDLAAAFREKLAELKARPGTTDEEFAELRGAAQTLANPERRKDYDATLPPVGGKKAQRGTRATPEIEVPPGPTVSEEPEGFLHTRAAAIGIPVALLVVAIVGWAMRTKPVQQPVVPKAATVAPAPAQEAEEEAPRGGPRNVVTVPTAPGTVVLSAEEVFATASSNIVRVIASDASGAPVSQGSGVALGANRVVTNCHVVRDGASIKVKSGKVEYPARLAVSDAQLDLCSLEVERFDAIAPVIGSVENLRTGQRVYAIGAPMGLDLTLSEGIVSSLREVENGKVIQTTAPVSPGSSGGGLFSADGQLVGIVTFQHKFGQNLNFAVPADWIAEMRNRKSRQERAETPAAVKELTFAEQVLGKWHCLGSLSGRNGEYSYGANGILTLSANDGRNFRIPYRVTGRSIQYQVQGEQVTLQVESISPTHMVQFVSEGQRLSCDRVD